MWVIVRDTAEELVYREIGKIVAIYRMEGGDHFLKVADTAAGRRAARLDLDVDQTQTRGGDGGSWCRCARGHC